jgi:hypothetical protein
MTTESNLPIPRTTLVQMVEAYVLAEQEIKQAFGLMVQARERLRQGFSQQGETYRFSLNGDGRRHGGRPDYDKPEEIMADVQREAWGCLVEKMELRRVLSNKREQELSKQLETGEGLPEIKLENILAMMEGTLNQAGQFIEELVQEVFRWLTSQSSRYVTNQREEIGPRVIRYCVRRTYSAGRFEVSYHYHNNVQALDRVFHALDGKGMVSSSYYGPLSDAISKAEGGKGETEYFRFKCFQNGNLHLEFRRLDLLAKLNQVAGGMRLRSAA